MVMTQVPALFLPKGSNGKKTTVKKAPLKSQKKHKPIKLAALLGGINGYKKDSKKSRRS
jgi:hypothetical protein